MKKIYILTAVFALLTLSLNAQLLKVDQNGKVVQPKAQAGKVVQPKAQNGKEVTPPDRYFRMGPSRASTDPVTPPYSNGFNSQDEFNWWETIDNNNDNRTWHLSNQQARVQWNGSSAMDDWLVSAPVHLVAGRVYKFYIDARSGGNYTERIEVKLASANTATALSSGTTVIAARNVTEQSYITLSNENVTVSQTGDYYFGIHGISIADQYYLYVDNFVIDVQVTDPTIQVAGNTVNMSSRPNGTANQTVAVTGLNLTTDITATVSGQDASLFSVSPASLGTGGGDLTITYSPTAVGTHTATITLSSTGANDVTITVNGACKHELTICDGTTTNGYLPVYGYYFEANQINQMVYPASRLTDLVGTTIKSMKFYPTTSGSYTGINFYNGSIEFSLGCLPENTSGYDTNRNRKTGYSLVATKNMPDAGQPSLTEWEIVFDTPFEYTGGDLLIDVNTVGGHWGTTNFYGVEQTGAGSYSRGTSLNDYGFYRTENLVQDFLPKVTFEYEDNTNPRVTVSPDQLTISDSGTNNTFNAEAHNIVQGENLGVTPHNGFSTTCTSSTNTVADWGFYQNNGSVNGTVAVNYTGRALTASDDIAVGTLGASTTVHVDYVPDLYIYCDYGASPWNFSANPAVAMTNNGDGTYTATLQNIPANSHILFGRASGLTYTWEGDDNRLFIGASTDGGDWGYGDNTSGYLDTNPNDDYPVKYHPIYFSEGGTYTITINANDYTFTITKLVYPAPENVVATADSENQTATVTWDVPSNLPTVTETVYESVTEGFDDQTIFPPFDLGGITADNHFGAIGGWTLYDATGARVYGMEDEQFTNMSEPQAWMVFNSSQVGIPAYSGNQYMESICPLSSTGYAAESWLISPELSGNAQTISFFERTLSNTYGNELYEVLVSSTDNDISSFSSLQPFEDAVLSWTERSVNLPAGTKYFAIRHYSNDIFGVLVDDVTYQIATTAEVPVAPISYNIYLDGQLVGSVNANNALTYNFSNLAVGDHECAVSAVYPGGIESEAVPAQFNIMARTAMPTISVVANADGSKTITATGDGTVHLYVDGQEVSNPYTIMPSIDGDITVTVTATAQEEGKLISETAEQIVTVAEAGRTPMPVITTQESNGYVVITATGDGTVTLTVDGQTVTGEGSASITIVKSFEDQNVTATATAQDGDLAESHPATLPVTIPALNTTPTNPESGLLRLHLLIVDQMKEEIPADNSHPDRYNYVLRYEPNGPQGEGVKESGTVKVDIQKADCEVTGYYSLKQIDGDTIIGLDHKQGITMDVVTADVAYDLSDSNDLLYEYLLQGAKNRDPGYQQDYLTKLRKSQNFTYFEMLDGPDKGTEYPNGEHHYLGEIETGTWGSTFMSYAPSVSTWGIQRRYYEDDGYDNTYGAPIWKSAVGEVKMSEEEAPIAERQTNQWNSVNWDDQGGPASLYILDNIWATAKLPHTGLATVQYEPYMFRVFVQSNNGLLRPYEVVEQGEGQYDGEHLVPVDRELTEADMKGPKCVWSGYLQFDEDGEVIGDLPNGVEVQIGEEEGQKTYTYHKSKVDRDGGSNAALPQPSEWDKDANNAMFGALDALAISGYDAQGKPILRNDITEDDLMIFVRFYYVVKGMADGWVPGSRGQGDDPAGYGSESGSSSPGVATGVNEIRYHGEVVSQTYYNVQGMTSDKPFDGVNIVVTRYSDGATVVSKVIR